MATIKYEMMWKYNHLGFKQDAAYSAHSWT
jgi:hypothetical protein